MAFTILPGGGNFYLNQYGVGAINLLTWPISIIWSLTQVAIDSETINELEIVNYYKYDPIGREEFIKNKI